MWAVYATAKERRDLLLAGKKQGIPGKQCGGYIFKRPSFQPNPFYLPYFILH